LNEKEKKIIVKAELNKKILGENIAISIPQLNKKQIIFYYGLLRIQYFIILN